MTVSQSEFHNNSAEERGGAIYVRSQLGQLDFNAISNEFTYNVAIDGGALSLDGTQILYIFDNLFDDNSAFTSGGSISVENSATNTVRNNSFLWSSASTVGGAVSISGNDDSMFQRNTYANCSASTAGALYFVGYGSKYRANDHDYKSPTFNFAEETFVSNSATTAGSWSISVFNGRVGLDSISVSESVADTVSVGTFNLNGDCNITMTYSSISAHVSTITTDIDNDVEVLVFSGLDDLVSPDLIETGNLITCGTGYQYDVSSTRDKNGNIVELISCHPCPSGEYLLESGHLPDGAFYQCLPCPDYVTCRGGYDLRASRGYSLHYFEKRNDANVAQTQVRAIYCHPGYCGMEDDLYSDYDGVFETKNFANGDNNADESTNFDYRNCARDENDVVTRTGIACSECTSGFCQTFGPDCVECEKCGTGGQVTWYIISNTIFMFGYVSFVIISPGSSGFVKSLSFFMQMLPIVGLSQSQLAESSALEGVWGVFAFFSRLFNLQTVRAANVVCPLKDITMRTVVLADFLAPLCYFCMFAFISIVFLCVCGRIFPFLYILENILGIRKFAPLLIGDLAAKGAKCDDKGDEGDDLVVDEDDAGVIELTEMNSGSENTFEDNVEGDVLVTTATDDDDNIDTGKTKQPPTKHPQAIRILLFKFPWRFWRQGHHLHARFTMAAATLVLLAYRNTLSSTLDFLTCNLVSDDKDGSELRWIYYGELKCYGWWQIFLWIWFIFFLIPFPIFLFFFRWFVKPPIPIVFRRVLLVLLEGSYRSGWKWWESVLYGRRLMMIGTFFVFSSNVFVRNLLIALLTDVFLVTHLICRPFKSKAVHWVETGSLSALALLATIKIGNGVYELEGLGSNSGIVQSLFWLQILCILLLAMIGTVCVVGVAMFGAASRGVNGASWVVETEKKIESMNDMRQQLLLNRSGDDDDVEEEL